MSAADAALAPLRRVARAFGEVGGLLTMLLAVNVSFAMMGSQGSLAIRLLGIAGMIATMLAIFARSADGAGHKAVRRLLKGSEPTAEERSWAQWLGVDPLADVETIKARARAIAKSAQADGMSGVDMDLVLGTRDLLVEAALRRSAPPAAEQLEAWRRAAGPLGQAWGWLLPSDRLLALRAQTGQSLLPRRRIDAAASI